MFIEFKLSHDFKRRAMDVRPKAPDGGYIEKDVDGTPFKIWFPQKDTLICGVPNGSCIGRVMRNVEKYAVSWYSDYSTR